VHALAPFAEWHGAADPRRTITIDNLIRMTSGLDQAETHSGWDPASQMLYSQRDMFGFARTTPIVDPPGTKFSYASGNAVMVSGIVRDRIGGGPQGLHQFLQRELTGPLSMQSLILETDAMRTPVGSTYALATARDWTKLGQLFLNQGVLEGRRFLPADWVTYSTTRTLNSDYGAGFWLPANGQDADESSEYGMDRLPKDAYFGLGYLGQYLIIIPSRNLVIARFGATLDPADKHGSGARVNGVGRLVTDVVAAIDAGLAK
jgi:CubicO group peptidase (beta-lactamase class C family)